MHGVCFHKQTNIDWHSFFTFENLHSSRLFTMPQRNKAEFALCDADIQSFLTEFTSKDKTNNGKFMNFLIKEKLIKGKNSLIVVNDSVDELFTIYTHRTAQHISLTTKLHWRMCWLNWKEQLAPLQKASPKKRPRGIIFTHYSSIIMSFIYTDQLNKIPLQRNDRNNVNNRL